MEHIPFKIYSASAGSGKTFTLVKEYLKICLLSKSTQKFVGVLAVTFTNKAASEMKERIIKSLKAFSSPKEAEQTELDMLALISEETGLSKEEIQKRAINIFEHILHNYSRFSIGTIDKFTHRIIRTFAQDLGLPANFEVEMEHELLLKQAVDLLISRSGQDKDLTQLFVNFIQDKTGEDKSWLIENDFYKIASELLKESGQKHCEKLKDLSLKDFFSIRKKIYTYIDGFDKEMETIGLAYRAETEKLGLQAEWFSGGANGLSKYFQYLREKRWEKYVPSATNLKNFDKEDWSAGKAPSKAISSIEQIREKFYPLAKKALEKLHDYPKYLQFRLIARNFYAMAVINEISKELENIKSQNNIIPIGEFNKKIAEVLQNEEGNFIYERLGERYANYFIDEFQDTSELQWKNLLPLIENAIADGLKPGSAMIVGDAKQAIYRWRGGEVDQFIDLQKKADAPVVGPYKMKNFPLDNNYRSTREVVEFNNKLFSSIAHQIKDEDYKALYHELKAQELKGPGGYVQLEYIENGDAHDDMQLESCLNSIRDLKGEGFNYGDICILTRTKAKGALLAKHLSDENIPVISSESLLLEQSTEVRFILNFLRFLNEPNHPRYRFKILEYLFEQEGYVHSVEGKHAELKNWSKGKLASFNKYLKGQADEYDMAKWKSLAIVELCNKIIHSFALENEAKVYTQFLLDEVWAYSTKYSQDLYGFLNYWKERAHKLSIAIPEGIDAVQVMTIHKSKGLEFPVVLFPFANWNATSERDAKSWVSINEPELDGLASSLIPLSDKLESCTPPLQDLYKEHQSKVLLDNLNMLYVALTRPKTRLYIFTSTKDRSKNLNEFFDTLLKEEGKWQEGQSLYSFGEKVKSKQKALRKNQTIKRVDAIEDISKVVRISKMAPKMWDVDAPEKGSDKGKKVHELLSYINDARDLESALEKGLRKGLISKSETPELRTLLERVLNDKDLKKYFVEGLKIKNEEDILRPKGEVLRPDRLVFDGNSVTIIDYKTGEEIESHKDQILGYKSIIEDMGYEVAKCILAYINDESVKLVEA